MYTYEVVLNTTGEQDGQLRKLQAVFAKACNAIAPVVRDTRCWNRVALHHLVYKNLRTQFPELGSQMVCNAIYSVCRTARVLFLENGGANFLGVKEGKQLPLLMFEDACPVYFDRHTLSLKNGRLSMFTLDGRIKFDVSLTDSQQNSFALHKLLEVVLLVGSTGKFVLKFVFEPHEPKEWDLHMYEIVCARPITFFAELTQGSILQIRSSKVCNEI